MYICQNKNRLKILLYIAAQNPSAIYIDQYRFSCNREWSELRFSDKAERGYNRGVIKTYFFYINLTIISVTGNIVPIQIAHRIHPVLRHAVIISFCIYLHTHWRILFYVDNSDELSDILVALLEDYDRCIEIGRRNPSRLVLQIL